MTTGHRLDMSRDQWDDCVMASIAPTIPNSTTVTFSEPEMSALRALLYAIQHQPHLEEMNRTYTMGLGSNHIETLVGLHRELTDAGYRAAGIQ